MVRNLVSVSACVWSSPGFLSSSSPLTTVRTTWRITLWTCAPRPLQMPFYMLRHRACWWAISLASPPLRISLRVWSHCNTKISTTKLMIRDYVMAAIYIRLPRWSAELKIWLAAPESWRSTNSGILVWPDSQWNSERRACETSELFADKLFCLRLFLNKSAAVRSCIVRVGPNPG